ncbi:MAG: DUF5654 family protein [Candidatus Magasanikbacteria bacterium]
MPTIDIKSEAQKVRLEVKHKIGTYIMAGLGLIVSLAWNEAVKSLIEKYFPLASGDGALAKLLYALILTILVVMVSLYIIKGEKK